MARVVVCGAMGRMGRAILGILKDRPNGLVLSGALETPGHPLLGQDAFEAAGAGKADVAVTSDFPSSIARADVAIDFTHAVSSVAHAKEAAAAGTPIVSGKGGCCRHELFSLVDCPGGRGDRLHPRGFIRRARERGRRRR